MNKILLGITGSIAAYKAPYLIRELTRQHSEVKVVLSKAAKSFVTPMTLQALSNNPVYEELLNPENEATMSHISLARWADIILVAPATAHCIAKLAHGFADDLLSTLCLVANTPIVLVPAMNQQMWLAAPTQENMTLLKQRGVLCWGPAEGRQACQEEGPGRMIEPDEIIHRLRTTMDCQKNRPLLGKHILITAGPTQEPIDPVRYISNRSSGKMGYALAQIAIIMGARVTLISGPVALISPANCVYISVNTAKEMLQAVEENIAKQDIFIAAAAVSDFYIENPATQKIKKDELVQPLNFSKTPDILMYVSQRHPRPFIVGFAAETENMLAYAKTKYIRKGVDLMIANDVSNTEIGFERDDNAVTILSDQEVIHLEKASKWIISQKIMEIICNSSGLV